MPRLIWEWLHKWRLLPCPTFRTLVPNGTLGTDHAWGSHHFIVGGSVLGGDFYGVPGSNGTVFPTLAANVLTTRQGTNARGRWIPTIA